MMAGTSAEFSSKETINYARLCRLLVDVGSQVLRETFDKIHPPGELQPVLRKNHSTLQLLRKKKVLNASHWGKLYPTIRSSVSSREFDITLLMVLLRNICGLIPPATGWDALPPVTDTRMEADIARVKYFRNTVYGHADQASVDDAQFNAYWQDIRDALVRLGGACYGVAIDDFKTECMDPEIEDHYGELLKQWKKHDDNIKDILLEMDRRLEELKASGTDMKDQKTDFLYRAGTDESPLFEVLNNAVWLITDPRLYYPPDQNPLRRITRATPVIYLWKTSIYSIPDTLKTERHPNLKEIVLLKLQETPSKLKDCEKKLKKIVLSIEWTQTPLPLSYPRGMTRMNVSVLVHAVLEYLEDHRPTTPQESNFQAELKAASYWYWFKENERMQFVSRHFDDVQLKKVAKLALEKWTKKLNEIKSRQTERLPSAKQGDSDDSDLSGSIEDEISDLEEAIFSLRMYYGKALEEADDDSFGSGTLIEQGYRSQSRIRECVSPEKSLGLKRKQMKKEDTSWPAKRPFQNGVGFLLIHTEV